LILAYCKHCGGVWFAVALEGERVVATSLSQTREDALKTLLSHTPAGRPVQVQRELSPLSRRLLEALNAIFHGEEAPLDFKLSMNHLSAYARKVLACTSSIPAGYVSTYGDVARAVGGSARSVGRVLALNPLPLLVPCHRVVGMRRGTLRLGGYSLGAEVKRKLLLREDRGYVKPRKIRFEGRGLRLYPISLLRGRI